jgi:alpha-galactosidase
MNKKIVLIGSGSQFTQFFLQEFFKYERFKGATLALVDRKPARLEQELILARNISGFLEFDANIEGYTDYKEALPGSDFVYCFAAVNGTETWKKEFSIAQKHGLNPFEAYTAGAPGLGMAIRHVPLMLDIAADMEKICPEAWLILDNNPLAKMLAALAKYTKVKHIGYCNGHELMQTLIEQFLGKTDRDASLIDADPVEREFMVPSGSVDLLLAGINHVQWILKVIDTKTGEDLMSLLFKKIEEQNIDQFPLGYKFTFEIAKLLKCIPSPADNHSGDYVWCIGKDLTNAAGLGPFDVDTWFGGMDADAWAKLAGTVTNKEQAEVYIKQRRTGWYNVLIAHEMSYGTPVYFPAINTINNGAIENLSDDIIVEVPGAIGPDYIRPVNVGRLPDHIAAICELHGRINNLVGEAAAEGDRNKALQALLLDPFIHDVTAAKGILEDTLEYNKIYETRF